MKYLPEYHPLPVKSKLKRALPIPEHQECNLGFFKYRGKIYDVGQRVLENDGMALVGVSPQNSYFNDQNIQRLLFGVPAYFKKLKYGFLMKYVLLLIRR